MSNRISSHLRRAVMRRAVITMVAAGAAVASPCYAKPLHTLIVVPPNELPALARQSGEAMLLHDTPDGRTLLYVEQNQGTRLAILDVTDPGRIKGTGTVQLDALGPFDFLSSVGSAAELIRFRDREEDGMLDLHRVEAPTLRRLQGLTLRGPVSPLGDDGFTVSSEAATPPQTTISGQTRDYQVVDTSSSRDASPLVVDVKNVREQLTNQDTGTTFILTDEGLYVVRRPTAESDKRRREQEWD